MCDGLACVGLWPVSDTRWRLRLPLVIFRDNRVSGRSRVTTRDRDVLALLAVAMGLLVAAVAVGRRAI